MEDAYEVTLQVTGMQCSGCVEAVENALKDLKGVHKVTVDLDSDEATIVFEDDKVEVDDLKKAVSFAGYTVEGVKS